MLHTVGGQSIPTALEASAFGKPQKSFPTYSLIQKIWNKVRYLQGATGFNEFSPIWANESYPELAKLQHADRWKRHGIFYLTQVISNGKLLSFETLREKYGLPQHMQFYYMQLRHAFIAQSTTSEWHMDPNPILSQLKTAEISKGFISQCYSTLSSKYLSKHPLTIKRKWEADIGPLDEDQWEEALQSVAICSLNVTQRLTQLYTLLRVYYTPHRLHAMGLTPTLLCTRCKRDHGELIHMLWRCPKLHVYWRGVIDVLSAVFQVQIPLDPRKCILNLLD